MKHKLLFFLFAAASCALAAEKLPATISATASLKDGSTVKGEFIGKRIVGSTIFMEKLALDPTLVKNVSFSGTNGDAKVELTGGDRFTMKVQNGGFPIRTILGELKVPRKAVHSLVFTATQHSTCSADNSGLIFHCTFEDEASFSNPAIGPSGTFKGGHIVPGIIGNALFIPAHTSCGVFNLPEKFLGEAGTIEFWGNVSKIRAPLSKLGSRFFEILALSKCGEISQDWNSNNGSGGSGLTFRVDGLSPMVTGSFFAGPSNPRFLRPPSGWHHYAVIWDVKGIKLDSEPDKRYSAIVMFDGNCILTVPFTPEWKGPTNLDGKSTLFFPNREDEMPYYTKDDCFIDEFKIWNYAKTDFPL